ncbi:methylaspartate mutase [Plantactinospora sp. BC1]|uniref:cobalamin B12-binding domain-containing protein n=1 Tax=Plantactinospora sp. BC1 TaxID=2108470 RepID=UPI000D16F9ED|nr:cobalamin B12-binding domain-containing protein [Plantactinospora sp. BC1]AVT28463.1 methylaspartate mutase [Plantactinospora sp. BC1]
MTVAVRPATSSPDRVGPAGPPDGRRMRVLLTSTASDAHTWNLVFLQLLIEELGHRVRNLGCCVPTGTVLSEMATYRPDLVVVSSVNGHGHTDGLRLISELRANPALAGVPVVIGGKLGIDGSPDAAQSRALLEAGFTAVFDDQASARELETYLNHSTSAVGG